MTAIIGQRSISNGHYMAVGGGRKICCAYSGAIRHAAVDIFITSARVFYTVHTSLLSYPAGLILSTNIHPHALTIDSLNAWHMWPKVDFGHAEGRPWRAINMFLDRFGLSSARSLCCYSSINVKANQCWGYCCFSLGMLTD